jgi:hypothetical protein
LDTSWKFQHEKHDPDFLSSDRGADYGGDPEVFYLSSGPACGNFRGIRKEAPQSPTRNQTSEEV